MDALRAWKWPLAAALALLGWGYFSPDAAERAERAAALSITAKSYAAAISRGMSRVSGPVPATQEADGDSTPEL